MRAIILLQLQMMFNFNKHLESEWTVNRYKQEFTNICKLYFVCGINKVLTYSAIIQFYKIFCSHFAVKLFQSVLHSNKFLLKNNVLIDLPSVFEFIFVEHVPTKMKSIMNKYFSRCLFSVHKLIKMGVANAGIKYDPSHVSSNNNNDGMNKIMSNININKNITIGIKNTSNQFFRKIGLFGAKSKPAVPKQLPPKMQKCEKIVIVADFSKAEFAFKAVEFYADSKILLDVVQFVPNYMEMFTFDDEEFEDEMKDVTVNEEINNNNNNKSSYISSSGFAVKRSFVFTLFLYLLCV